MCLAAGSMNNANETNSSRPSAKPNTHLYALLVKDVRGCYYEMEEVCILIMDLIDFGFPFLERWHMQLQIKTLTIKYNTTSIYLES